MKGLTATYVSTFVISSISSCLNSFNGRGILYASPFIVVNDIELLANLPVLISLKSLSILSFLFNTLFINCFNKSNILANIPFSVFPCATYSSKLSANFSS